MKWKRWPLAVPVALVAYLLLWPVPVEPVKWSPPGNPGYVGAFVTNERLAGLQTIGLDGHEGPEHVRLGPDGKLYVAVDNGDILRMDPDGAQLSVFARSGGRVLGFDFDAAGNLIAADAERGLLSIYATGEVALLADSAEGKPIAYADGVVVARSGKIYFTDASMRFSPARSGGTFEASILDLIEQSSTGRVLEYDPVSKATRVVAMGLSFANGIALSADETKLFVAETGKYRIWSLDATGQNLDAGSGPQPGATILIDALPGYPDNLMRGLDGRIWAGLVKPRNSQVDGLADRPSMRKIVMRLPRFLWPIPPAYGHVFAFDESGNIVSDLQDPKGPYPETTGVTETADRLYIQSLHAKTLGWMPNTLVRTPD